MCLAVSGSRLLWYSRINHMHLRVLCGRPPPQHDIGFFQAGLTVANFLGELPSTVENVLGELPSYPSVLALQLHIAIRPSA